MRNFLTTADYSRAELDALIESALRYRVQAPLIDQVLKEIGIEGGSLALLALINRTLSGKKRWTSGIVMLGVFATAWFYGDSMITPAISVLSAVEGLTTVNAGVIIESP